MSDEAAAETVTRMLHAIDALDWAGVRACFADRVRVDYTSLDGGEPAELAADDLLASWMELLPGFDATQHITGPVLATVEGGSASAATHVRGYHHLKGAAGGEAWMVAGHYAVGLARQGGAWLIEALTLRAFYQEGNLDLPALARERVARGVLRNPTGA